MNQPDGTMLLWKVECDSKQVGAVRSQFSDDATSLQANGKCAFCPTSGLGELLSASTICAFRAGEQLQTRSAFAMCRTYCRCRCKVNQEIVAMAWARSKVSQCRQALFSASDGGDWCMEPSPRLLCSRPDATPAAEV